MKALSLVLLFSLVSVSLSFSQPPDTLWTRIFDTGYIEQFTDMELTPEGGFYLAGWQKNPENQSAFFIKTDSMGDTIWQTFYDENVQLSGSNAIALTSDGGFVFVGPFQDYSYTATLTGRLTSDGEIIWAHQYAPPRYYATNVSTCGQDIEVLAGDTIVFAGYYIQQHYIKCPEFWEWTPSGDTIFAHCWPPHYQTGPLGDGIFDLEPDGMGNLVLAGDIEQGQGCIRKINAQGFEVWRSQIGIAGATEQLKAIRKTADGGYIAVGTANAPPYYNGLDVWIIKTNQTGNLQWERHYGGRGTDRALDVIITHEGKYLICGETESFGAHQQDAFVMGIDTDGELLWLQTYRGDLVESFNSIRQLPDESFVAAGYGNWHYNSSLRAPTSGDGILVHYGDHGPEPFDYSGIVELIYSADSLNAFRVTPEMGFVSQVTFSDLPLGSRAWVTGAASGSWSASCSGNTASFVSTMPVQPIIIDTFWLSLPDNHLRIKATSGCWSDTICIMNGALDLLSFQGAVFDSGYLRLEIITRNENNLSTYIIKASDRNRWRVVDTLYALNDTGVNQYTFVDEGFNIYTDYFLLTVNDIYGCQHEYNDRTLSRWRLSTPLLPLYSPSQYHLSAFPNPFNPSTTISFSLPKSARSRLVIYDLLGREVAVLTNQILDAGEHQMQFEGSDLPSGLYFARLQSGEFVTTQKLLLVK